MGKADIPEGAGTKWKTNKPAWYVKTHPTNHTIVNRTGAAMIRILSMTASPPSPVFALPCHNDYRRDSDSPEEIALLYSSTE
ncbi:MAG: hypothetical protein GY869_17095 [Planctomycetes bacterium]|nr:hypothetical protein [Planctomycetota bacterium]